MEEEEEEDDDDDDDGERRLPLKTTGPSLHTPVNISAKQSCALPGQRSVRA
jgi:hypothetical protein